MAGEDDLKLVIDLVAGGDTELARDITSLIDKIDGAGAGQRLADDLGKGFAGRVRTVFSAGVGAGMKDAAKETQKGSQALLSVLIATLRRTEQAEAASLARRDRTHAESWKKRQAVTASALRQEEVAQKASEARQTAQAKGAQERLTVAEVAAARRRVAATKGAEERRTVLTKGAVDARLQAQRSGDARQQAFVEAGLKTRLQTQRTIDSQIVAQFRAGLDRMFQAQVHSDRTQEQQQKQSGRERVLLLDRLYKNFGELLRRATFSQVAADRSALQQQRAADRARLASQRSTAASALQTQRASDAARLQSQRSADRLQYVDQQASQARRTAITRSFVQGLRSTYTTGLGLIASTWRSHLAKRNIELKTAGDKEANLATSSMRRQETAARLGFQRIDATYTAGARRRLATIEREAAAETRVITAAQIKRANAQATLQRRTQTGIAGAIGQQTGIGGVGLGSGLLTAAAAFGGIATIKSAITAASDLNESQSKFGVVFRNLTASGLKNLQAFANGSATSLGISKQAALESLGTFGNLFAAMKIAPTAMASMSQGLVQLAADLASFNNADPKEVLLALRSGLVGEVEPLRKFGVNLSQARIEAEAFSLGLVKSQVSSAKLASAQIAVEQGIANRAAALKKYGADSIQVRSADAQIATGQERLAATLKGTKVTLTAAQKAQAAYSIITKDTTLAQGDFARTSMFLANAQRISKARMEDLRATIGKFLLPLYLKLTLVTTGFIQNLAHGDGIYRVVRQGLLGIAVGLGAVLAVKAGVQVLGLLSSGLSLLATNPVIAIGLGLAFLGGAVFNLARNVGPIKDFFSSLIEGTKNWITVGFRVGKPIEGLSNIVRITSGIGAYARHIRDFFVSLVDGFKNWGKVGFLIDGPIKGLSAIVFIQSSIGAAARRIADAVKGIVAVLGSFFGGKINFKTAKALIVTLLGDLVDRISELTAPLGKAIGDLASSARKEVGKRFGALFAGIGGFIKAGGLGDLVGVIVGVVQVAFASAKAFVGDFFTGLFKGTKKTSLLTVLGVGERGGDASVAATLGARLRGIFSRVGAFVGPIAKGLQAAFGTAIAALGAWFITTGGPLILKGLYALGNFIGGPVLSTILSEPVLRALLVAATAIIAAAGALLLGLVDGVLTSAPKVITSLRHIIHDIMKAAFGAVGDNAILGPAITAISGFLDTVFANAARAFRGFDALWDAIFGPSAGRKKALDRFKHELISGQAATLREVFINLPRQLGALLDGLFGSIGKAIGGLGDRLDGPFRPLLAVLGGIFELVGRVGSFVGKQASVIAGAVGALFRGDFSGFVSKWKEGLGNVARLVIDFDKIVLKVGKGVLIGFFDGMLNFLPAGIRLLGRIPTAIAKFFEGLPAKVKGPGGGLLRAVLAPLIFALKSLGNFLDGVGRIAGHVGDIVGAVFSGKFSKIPGLIGRIFQDLGHLILVTVKNIVRMAVDIVAGLGSAVVAGFRAIVREAIALPGQIIRAIAGLPGAIANLFKKDPSSGGLSAAIVADALGARKKVEDASTGARGPVDKLKQSWSGLGDSIDRATQKYKDYLTALDNGKTPLAASRIAIGQDAQTFFGAKTGDERQVALSQARNDFAEAKSQIDTKALGDQERFNKGLDEYKSKLLTQILPGLQEQNRQLGDNALSQDALTKKAKEFIDTVIGAPKVTPVHFEVEGTDEFKKSLGDIIAGAAEAGANGFMDRLVFLFAAQKTRLQTDGGGNGNANFTPTARGGIFRRPARRLIAEAGPEAVIPLNDPRRAAELLKQAGLASGVTTSSAPGLATNLPTNSTALKGIATLQNLSAKVGRAVRAPLSGDTLPVRAPLSGDTLGGVTPITLKPTAAPAAEAASKVALTGAAKAARDAIIAALRGISKIEDTDVLDFLKTVAHATNEVKGNILIAVRNATVAALKGIAQTIKDDPSTKAFFKAFSHASEEDKANLFKTFRDLSNDPSRVFGPSPLDTGLRPANLAITNRTAAQVTGLTPRMTPAQLDRLATAAPTSSSNPVASSTVTDAQLNKLITAIETHGLNSPLVGGDINIEAAREPERTAQQVIMGIRKQPYLGFSGKG